MRFLRTTIALGMLVSTPISADSLLCPLPGLVIGTLNPRAASACIEEMSKKLQAQEADIRRLSIQYMDLWETVQDLRRGKK